LACWWWLMASILDTLAVREAVVPISVEQYRRLGEL
jgi:hypothetical protein